MIVNSVGVKSPSRSNYGNNSAENSRNLVLGPTFRGGEMQKSISAIKGVPTHKLRTLALAFLTGAATIFGASTLTSCEKDDPIKPPVDNPIGQQSEISKKIIQILKNLGIEGLKSTGEIVNFKYHDDWADEDLEYKINKEKSDSSKAVFDMTRTLCYSGQKFYEERTIVLTKEGFNDIGESGPCSRAFIVTANGLEMHGLQDDLVTPMPEASCTYYPKGSTSLTRVRIDGDIQSISNIQAKQE